MRDVYFISGLMGSGKSTVADYIRYKNHEVIKMDDFAKSFMEENAECKIELVRAFGKNVLDDMGQIDKEYLREVYFQPDLATTRDMFETQLDNMLYRKLLQKINDKNFGRTPLFLEVPAFDKDRFMRFVSLFYESLRHVFWVFCNEDLRRERLIKRGMSVEQIELRDSIQSKEIPVFETVQNKVIPISNNGTEEDLFNATNKALSSYLTFETAPHGTKKDYAMIMIRDMSHSVLDKFFCNGIKTTFGCAACPYPCENYTDQK